MEEKAAQESFQKITDEIKKKLIDRHMTQVELGKLINEKPVQLNRAIKGYMNPQSIKIREKVYKVLDIKDES
ncbi:transcriptional regulator [Fructilactobacillus frigidiflavus]|uniref:transcriptional regulator n=1 Tax=Fructilactobacillus frigidiflavus TaxID=3242688 RepID=UPI003757A0AD